MNAQTSSAGGTLVVDYAAADTDTLIERLQRETPKGRGICMLLLGEPEFEKLKFAHSVARVTGYPLQVIATPALVGERLTQTHENLGTEFEKVRVGGTVLFFSDVEALFKRDDAREVELDQIKREVAFLCRKAQTFHGFTLLSVDTPEHLSEQVLKETVRVIVTF